MRTIGVKGGGNKGETGVGFGDDGVRALAALAALVEAGVLAASARGVPSNTNAHKRASPDHMSNPEPPITIQSHSSLVVAHRHHHTHKEIHRTCWTSLLSLKVF